MDFFVQNKKTFLFFPVWDTLAQEFAMHIMGLQKTTLLDYPHKVACTVFFGGCNFRCPFCHNAGLVLENSEQPVLEEEEFFAFLSRRTGLLDGVCISGGEPMLQQGLQAFATRIKEMGFLVKIDTNGSFPERLETLIEKNLVDYVSMDIKNSRKSYGKTIGIPGYDTQPIERSVTCLRESGIPYEFRTTILREYHTFEDLEAIGKWIKGCRAYYLQTFENSGDLIGKNTMTPFDRTTMEKMQDLLKQDIPDTFLRGV
jgi:pyruvate formate lyase activating enzyme